MNVKKAKALRKLAGDQKAPREYKLVPTLKFYRGQPYKAETVVNKPGSPRAIYQAMKKAG
jgi:hypothetical protein